MGLGIYLTEMQPVDVWHENITHNLTKMAEAAGLYQALWHPETIGIKKAKDLIPILKEGWEKLIDEPDKYRAFNPENGYGSYEGLVKFVYEYYLACQEHPDADVVADI